MNLYYNKKGDKQSCGVNSKGLQGCLGGFFQPVENPSYEAAKACPSGYWCPVNLICTIPCPYGELSMAMASNRNGNGNDNRNGNGNGNGARPLRTTAIAPNTC